jgi:hypothetical protein
MRLCVGDGLDHGDIMVFDDACSTKRSTGSDPSHGMNARARSSRDAMRVDAAERTRIDVRDRRMFRNRRPASLSEGDFA